MRKPKSKTRSSDTTTVAHAEPQGVDDVHVGQIVYRVVEHEPPEGEFTWKILERRIVQVTKQKLMLDRPFPGSNRLGLVPKSVCVGRLFHLSIAAALDHFHESALRNLAFHDRRVAAAKRELDWWQAEADAQQRKHDELTAVTKSDDALFVILGSRDDSDLDASTDDYAVCYFFDEDTANKRAEHMNALASKLDTLMPPTEEETRAMREIDPRWAPGARGGVARPTQYRVERIPPGRTES